MTTKAFNRTRAAPTAFCQCGGDCGLSWKVVAGQRSRRFAKGCPVRAEQLKAEAREYQRRKKLDQPHAEPRKRQSATVGRESNDWCGTCAGLEHRRQKPICPECREPFQELEPLNILDFATNRFQEERWI